MKKQKQLLLSNISEIYAQFKKENPDRKIGFLMLMKWCISVGAAGTPNACVWSYHQNVKLMLVVMNLPHNYRQIMEMCVCDVVNYDCIMRHCDDCPDPSVLKSSLRKQIN